MKTTSPQYLLKAQPHSVLRLAISLGIAIVAAVVASPSASAQLLYTTQDDFSTWADTSTTTPATIHAVTTPDYDGVTINGLGNNSDGPGSPDTAGSLSGTLNAQSYFEGFGPQGAGTNDASSPAFMTALLSAGTLTLDYTGTLYHAPGIDFYWGGAVGGGTFSAIDPTSSTTETGPGGSFNLVTYNFAAQAATFNAYQAANGPITYLFTGLYVAGDSGATFDVDAITADPAVVPEPSTTALLALGGLGLIMLLRRRKLA